MSTTSDLKPRLCRVEKGPSGFGFNLHGEKQKPGQFIRKVDEGSPAELMGLRVDDRLVEVNGANIEELTHKEVVVAIKSGGVVCTMLVVDPETDGELKKRGLTATVAMSDTGIPEETSNNVDDHVSDDVSDHGNDDVSDHGKDEVSEEREDEKTHAAGDLDVDTTEHDVETLVTPDEAEPVNETPEQETGTTEEAAPEAGVKTETSPGNREEVVKEGSVQQDDGPVAVNDSTNFSDFQAAKDRIAAKKKGKKSMGWKQKYDVFQNL